METLGIKMKRAALGAATAALVGASLIAAPGVSNAATAGFRLSNFGSFVATICVITDTSNQCSGWIKNNKSTVYSVNYNDPQEYYCIFQIQLADSYRAKYKFNRNDYKECKLEGTVGKERLYIVRGDGTPVQVEHVKV